MTKCDKCLGDGWYCWTCGEIEQHCECPIDTSGKEPGCQNIGICFDCDGSGETFQ